MSEMQRDRLFAFRLRTLFVMVAILAVPCAWFCRELHFVRQRRQLSNVILVPIVCSFSRYDPERGQLSWVRRWLGDSLQPDISLPRETSPTLVDQVRNAFPEAQVQMIDAVATPPAP